MDVSSELVHGLLPLYLVTTLNASTATVGAIEGVADATVASAKWLSGSLSDRLRSRKGLVVLGYGLAALTRPVFPLATSVGWVLGARIIDRVGKGVRESPRDALISDITPQALRGAAYGLRQSLDSLGALVGPLVAVALMWWWAGDIRRVLWAAVAPAIAAATLLGVFVREPERAALAASGPESEPSFIARLPRGYWAVVAVGMATTLARFSDAFLVLRSYDVGLSPGLAPAVMIAANLPYAAAAYPAGILADRLGSRGLLASGMALLVAAHLSLAAATAPALVVAAAVCWGAHMATTQGVLAKLVADAVPARLRGRAFGVFSLATGAAAFAANSMAGALWSTRGASAAFMTGALLAAIAALGASALPPSRRKLQR